MIGEIKEKARILVCPLNWGLGHATRCIPLIKSFIEKKMDVTIAGEGDSLKLLKDEFPDLACINFPSFKIKYPIHIPISLKIILLLPYYLFWIIKEHNQLKKIIKSHKIDIVISDNRYGLWNKNIYTIFITHQLLIKMPKALKIIEYPVHLLIKQIIKKYNKCWIPDEAGQNNFSGDLSHKYKLPINAEFIGVLTRFNNLDKPRILSQKYEIVVVLSGPEPYRTILQKMLFDKILESKRKAIIIMGLLKKDKAQTTIKNITLISHLPTNLFSEILSSAKYIICRSGYSSIMDLIGLCRNAILIPTPGQTEQEYLAKHLQSYGLCHSVNQKELAKKDLNNILLVYDKALLVNFN